MRKGKQQSDRKKKNLQYSREEDIAKPSLDEKDGRD